MSPSYTCSQWLRQYQQGGSKGVLPESIHGSLPTGRVWCRRTVTTVTSNAETFLVSGLKKTDCSTFDEYRWERYHNCKKELDFNQLVCCSSTIQEHIKRAYLQGMMWLQAPTPAVTKPDPLQYGYEKTDGLPPPCKCPTSYMSTKTCTCIEWNIKCVTCCGCSKGKKCKNPNN